MKRDDFLHLYNALVQQAQELNQGKSTDYASHDDVLSNFKRLSQAAKVLNIDVSTASGYALFMVLMKIDRINNLIKNNRSPANETVSDSFVDALNYLILAYGTIMDGEIE